MRNSTPRTAYILPALLPLLALSCSQSNEPFWTKKKIHVDSGSEVTPAPEDPRFTTTTTTAPEDPRFTDQPAKPDTEKQPETHLDTTTRPKPNVKFVDVGSKVKDGPSITPPPETEIEEPTDPLLKDASEIHPSGGRFIIWVPEAYTTLAEVDEKKQKLEGNLEIVINKASGENGTCMSAYNDFQADYVKTRGEDGVRNEIIDGFLGSLSGKIIRKDKIKLSGREATSIRFTGKNNMYGRLIVLIDGHRAYQLAFLSSVKTEPEQPRVESFFKSFKLLKN